MRSCGIHFPGVLVRDTASHNGFIRLIAYDQRTYLVIRTEEVPCTTRKTAEKDHRIKRCRCADADADAG